MIHPSEKQIAQLVQTAFPQSTLLHSWPLSGGLSAGMVALEIQQPDGPTQKLIVRSHQQAAVAENEFRLLQILQTQGFKTPASYLLDLSGPIFALLIEYVAGEMTFSPADRNHHLQQLATQLAQIHSLDVAQPDFSFLPENKGSCVELGRERPSSNANFLQENEIHRILAGAFLPATNKVALLHGDFWPGNSLWCDGELTAVIDWEDAHLGDPLIDLAQSRSEIAWIFGAEALESFTHHYQSQMPIDYGPLPYWDLCAALRQIRLVGEDLAGFADYFGGYGRTDITPATIRQNLGIFIDQAFARLVH